MIEMGLSMTYLEGVMKMVRQSLEEELTEPGIEQHTVDKCVAEGHGLSSNALGVAGTQVEGGRTQRSERLVEIVIDIMPLAVAGGIGRLHFSHVVYVEIGRIVLSQLMIDECQKIESLIDVVIILCRRHGVAPHIFVKRIEIGSAALLGIARTEYVDALLGHSQMARHEIAIDLLAEEIDSPVLPIDEERDGPVVLREQRGTLRRHEGGEELIAHHGAIGIVGTTAHNKAIERLGPSVSEHVVGKTGWTIGLVELEGHGLLRQMARPGAGNLEGAVDRKSRLPIPGKELSHTGPCPGLEVVAVTVLHLTPWCLDIVGIGFLAVDTVRFLIEVSGIDGHINHIGGNLLAEQIGAGGHGRLHE